MAITFSLVALFMCLFFFNDTATTEIYTLSLHDALPICAEVVGVRRDEADAVVRVFTGTHVARRATALLGAVDQAVALGDDLRSEEHTSELQSRENLVCRLLLEKKKK